MLTSLLVACRGLLACLQIACCSGAACLLGRELYPQCNVLVIRLILSRKLDPDQIVVVM